MKNEMSWAEATTYVASKVYKWLSKHREKILLFLLGLTIGLLIGTDRETIIVLIVEGFELGGPII